MRDLLIFDFETTSNKPESTRVVQQAAMHNDVVVFNELCNPGLQISDGACEVHGITDEMVRDKPSDTERVTALAQYILERKDEIIIAGHNVTTFDIPIMWRIAGVIDPPKIPVIDTLTCAIRTLPYADSHKLGDLFVALGLGSAENAHDALGDIEMVKKLIFAFMSALGYDLEALVKWLATPRVLKTCHFGKHKGKPWGKGPGCVPSGYAMFMAKNFEDPHPDVELTILHHYGYRFSSTLKKKGVIQ